MFSWLTGRAAKSLELKEAESVFTEAELKLIQKYFSDEVNRQDKTSGRSAPVHTASLDVGHFGALLGPMWRCLDPLIASHLHLQLVDKADGRVHLSGLIIAKARAERLGEQASLEFSYRLLSPDGKGAGYKPLEAAVLSCLRLTGAVPLLMEGPDKQISNGTAAVASSGTLTTTTTSVCGSSTAPQNQSTGSSNTDKNSSGGENSNSRHTTTITMTTTTTSIIKYYVQQHIEALCRGVLLNTADGALGEKAANLDDLRMSYDQYCKWTKNFPALHKALCSVLRGVGVAASVSSSTADASSATFAATAATKTHGELLATAFSAKGTDPLRLPVLRQLGKLQPGATLLQPVWTWALASRLPPAQRVEWRLLFNSQRDGKSFNTFYSRASAAAGPTLLLLRDKAGALFGGYASQPWAKSGSYYGDVSCFIFSLLPALQIFPATGINDNFQWCGVGFNQLPGGIGFGGAASARGHFALYVEPSLDSGMSRPIATYANIPLASEQLFQIDTLECWLLHPPEEEANDSSASGARTGGSILGKAAEDRAIMELSGFKMHSAGLRDEPLEED